MKIQARLEVFLKHRVILTLMIISVLSLVTSNIYAQTENTGNFINARQVIVTHDISRYPDAEFMGHIQSSLCPVYMQSAFGHAAAIEEMKVDIAQKGGHILVIDGFTEARGEKPPQGKMYKLTK